MFLQCDACMYININSQTDYLTAKEAPQLQPFSACGMSSILNDDRISSS